MTVKSSDFHICFFFFGPMFRLSASPEKKFHDYTTMCFRSERLRAQTSTVSDCSHRQSMQEGSLCLFGHRRKAIYLLPVCLSSLWCIAIKIRVSNYQFLPELNLLIDLDTSFGHNLLSAIGFLRTHLYEGLWVQLRLLLAFCKLCWELESEMR